MQALTALTHSNCRVRVVHVLLKLISKKSPPFLPGPYSIHFFGHLFSFPWSHQENVFYDWRKLYGMFFWKFENGEGCSPRQRWCHPSACAEQIVCCAEAWIARKPQRTSLRRGAIIIAKGLTFLCLNSFSFVLEVFLDWLYCAIEWNQAWHYYHMENNFSIHQHLNRDQCVASRPFQTQHTFVGTQAFIRPWTPWGCDRTIRSSSHTEFVQLSSTVTDSPPPL